MKYVKKISRGITISKVSIISIILFLFPSYSYNQDQVSLERSIISNSGSESTNNSIQLEWTFGESVIGDRQIDDFHLLQGFQQATFEEINSISTSTFEKHYNVDQISIYPNPARSILFIKSINLKIQNCWILDQNGKVLSSKLLDVNESEIPIDILTPGLYFIKINLVNQYQHTFPFIKS